MSTGPRSPVAGIATQKTFYFEGVADDGAVLRGSFTVRRPTVVDQARIEAEKSELLGGKYYDPARPGSGVPEHAAMMAEALAFLRVTIVQSPPWWNDGNIYDMSILAEIYKEAETVDPFRTTIAVSGRNDHQDGEGGDSERLQSEPDDVLAQMVDR